MYTVSFKTGLNFYGDRWLTRIVYVKLYANQCFNPYSLEPPIVREGYLDDRGHIVLFFCLKAKELILERDVFKEVACVISETDMAKISEVVIAYIKANWTP